MPASLLTELVIRPIFEIVFYGIAYVIGAMVIPIFTFGRYTVEPWDPRKRTKTKNRATQLAPRMVSGDAAAAVGIGTLLVAALVVYFLWRASGA